MAYSNEAKATALSLYLIGENYKEITGMTGVTDKTLTKWAAEGNWEVRKTEHLKLLQNETVVDITDFKLKMIKQLEKLRDNLIEDFSISKNPTKDKVLSGILDINKQILLLKGLPTEVSKVNQQVEVKHMKLEDYFK